MTAKAQDVSSSTNSQTFYFEADVKMSKFQPSDIKPSFNLMYLNNGVNNCIYDRYRNAYNDSPTNASIINAFVNYMFGEGLINASEDHATAEELTVNQAKLSKYISQEDALLMSQDYKLYGGFACQVIYSYMKVPLRIEYIPIYKLAISFKQGTNEVDGYWFSWDWTNNFKYRPVLYPKFTGAYKDNDLEILVVRRPTAEPFFPIPDYFSGIPWAEVEGELANTGKSHFKNIFGAMTVINYNNGKMATVDLAKSEAKRIRDNYCGSDNEAKVIVSFNESPDSAVTVDQLSPPELNNQNVFYSEEAERKLIVAHSAPPILFAGSNSGSGFSSNADEIAVATKGLYKRHINPMRKIFCNGLQQVFDLLPDEKIKLDFYDFKEEEQIKSA